MDAPNGAMGNVLGDNGLVNRGVCVGKFIRIMYGG